jgi:hypothetical protein
MAARRHRQCETCHACRTPRPSKQPHRRLGQMDDKELSESLPAPLLLSLANRSSHRDEFRRRRDSSKAVPPISRAACAPRGA